MQAKHDYKPRGYSPGTTLMERVKKACTRLEDRGWADLFRSHGLDLRASDLKAELLKPLDTIDRNLPGFRDFAHEGVRGIEPGRPGLSLLYHAFASPQVTTGADGSTLQDFPTPAEIEDVLNLVYGICPPSIQELRARVDDAPLAVVVFASEYRPAITTVHQNHADLCFSRVGVSRVGTAPRRYLPEARGYLPFVDDDPHAIRVLPCRFSAYIAAQFPGQPAGFGPLRFQTTPKSDAERLFWVPVHKLFSGAECLRGVSLTVTITSRHVNEKLRRVHRVLAGEGIDTGWHEPALSRPPFIFNDGLAALSADPDDGEGLIVPVDHPRLVQAVVVDSRVLSFKVPAGREPFRSSLIISSRPSSARSAPEYVHVRHRVEADGTVSDLNEQPDMLDIIRAGDYEAVHYLDFTADGSIQADCPELALELPRSLAAYSMVTAVDYFPLVKQQELLQWWKQSVPPELLDNIWPTNPGPPLALCDIRYAANLSLTLDKLDIENNPRPVFDRKDDTLTAIVGLLGSSGGRPTRVEELINDRASSLSDGAAGVFAPGWDVSIDRSDEVAQDDGSVEPGSYFLNNYGLGSPFPEDAMLCAALSSFWPAAAPDVTRTFAPGTYATATPLTDDLLGMTGEEPWDGIHGPRIPDPDLNEVEYRVIEYGDYVQTMLNAGFNIAKVGQTTAPEYAARTLVMARVYQSLGAVTREQKRRWAIYSFTQSAPHDPTRVQAEDQAGVRLSASFAYRFQVFEHKPLAKRPADHQNRLVGFDKMLTIFADPRCVLKQNDVGIWTANRY